MKFEDAIQQEKFENRQVKAWLNLIYTHNQLTDNIKKVFKKFSITHQQYNVLRILRGRKGSPANCSEVKEVMLDKNPDLTRLSDRLVSKGLIERRPNPENRREVELTITTKGLGLLEQIDPELNKNNGFLFNLSDSEADQLSRLLDKMRG